MSKEDQQQGGIAILKTTIDYEDISEDATIEIKISHRSLPELYSDVLHYGDLRHLVKKPLSTNFIQKLMSEITREFANNSHRNQYQQGDFKADPFEAYINCLFSQLFPCIWIGSFKNAAFLKHILRNYNFEDKAVDFILLDNKKNSSTILIECTRQFLSDRSIVGEYECGKLARVKTLLEQQGLHDVYAIIVCAELYSSNPQLYDSVIERFNDIHFLFKEDLESIQANIDAVSMHEDMLRFCRILKR